MKKYLIISGVIILGVIAYATISSLTKSGKKIIPDQSEAYKLPKVLLLTTGGLEGNGELSEGVVVAIQSFNKKGAFVWLDNRNVLLQPEILAGYSLILAPTSIGYHDGDKKYSLTYLSDIEMENIANWVKNGGTLIAEENIGRNNLDEKDRADLNAELNSKNWILADVFGIKMKEIDLSGYAIDEKENNIWGGRIKQTISENEWALVPTEITSDKVKVLAEWTNNNDKVPAIIQNDFGKGKAYLLTSTYLLHPSNDGGISSIEQIENFYNYVLDDFPGRKISDYELNPWPDGKSTAFCISFNSDGDIEKYKSVLNFLKKESLPATFFIDSSFSDEEKNLLNENKNILLQSNLYSKQDFSTATYSEIIRQFLMNEQLFGKKFTGIRFPFGSTNFYGLIYANDKGYVFDSSIGVDHLTSYSGSVFPYNIPVALNSYYKTLNLLELCPVKYEDVFYYQKADAGNEYTEDIQRSDAQLFQKYLMDFYSFAVEKNNGLMIYAGSPHYTGFSELTMTPLKSLTDTLRTKNCWISTLEEVAEYRNKLKELNVQLSESGKEIKLKIILPEQITVKGFSLKLKSKPKNIRVTDKYDLKEINHVYYLITDVKKDDEISMSFP